MELSVWTSCEVQKAAWDDASKVWSVIVRRGESKPQVVSVKHIIFATGFGGGVANYPEIPDQAGSVPKSHAQAVC
jgi:cation diffusion facilitator CzcD-associated flavoprotein CzcO